MQTAGIGTFAALAVYAAGFFLMWGFSLAYNMVPPSALKWLLRRFDHSMIYVMIAGTGTIGGEPNEVVKMSDIKDGTSNTIMAIEVAGSGISWLEPRDMTVDEAIAYITNPGARSWFSPK